jgi:hypothetical protein
MFTKLRSAGDDGSMAHTTIAMGEVAAIGAFALRQELGDLRKFSIVLVCIFDVLSGEKTNSAEINTICNPVGSDCSFFTAFFVDDLHLAQTNNRVHTKPAAANSMK